MMLDMLKDLMAWLLTSLAAAATTNPDLWEDNGSVVGIAGVDISDDGRTLVIVTKNGVELHARIVIERKKETP